jgi:hypothetical protein
MSTIAKAWLAAWIKIKFHTILGSPSGSNWWLKNLPKMEHPTEWAALTALTCR